jgi:glycosyltransferase involved in cell wall biosynthesis
MDVSVIIPTYNREEMLVQTIKCLLNQKFEYDYEILIVDQTKKHNDLTQEFLNKIQETEKKIRYFLLDNSGLTPARNFGLKNCKGNIIIFVDDDITCDENFIKNHYLIHKEGFDVVQGRVIETNKEHRIKKNPTWIYPWIKFLGGNNCLHRAKTNSLTGCNFSITQKVVEKVGYFDERYINVAIREDSDYGYRCYKAKMNMIFDPSPCVIHHRCGTGGVETGMKNIIFEPVFYDCQLLFASKHFLPILKWFYYLRLKHGAKKHLYSMIKDAYIRSKKYEK